MLTNGNLVLTNQHGDRKLVESLRIGEPIFDPWRGQDSEITDILSRKIRFDGRNSVQLWLFKPMTISRGTFGKNRPMQDVCVSPSQEVMHVDRSNKRASAPTLEKSSTRSLLERRQSGIFIPEVSSITYFAIFTERPSFMEVSGMLLPTYCSEFFEPGKNDELTNETLN